jgi:hypothetical protein
LQRKSFTAPVNNFTSSSDHFNTCRANLNADFLPVPGSLANSLTAFSSNTDGYFCVITNSFETQRYVFIYKEQKGSPAKPCV